MESDPENFIVPRLTQGEILERIRNFNPRQAFKELQDAGKYPPGLTFEKYLDQWRKKTREASRERRRLKAKVKRIREGFNYPEPKGGIDFRDFGGDCG